MQQSLPIFLRQLHLWKSSIRELDVLKPLSQDNFEELKNLNLLVQRSDSTHVICPSCDEVHSIPVRCDEKGLYTACSRDVKKNYLQPRQVQNWGFNVELFLQQLALKFEIAEQVTDLLVDGLWLIGDLYEDGVTCTCYFFHGKDFAKVVDFLKAQPVKGHRYVIFTCKQEAIPVGMLQKTLLIEVHKMADLQSGEMKFKKAAFKSHLKSGFRSVFFDTDNGDLRASDQLIVNVQPSSPEYFFVRILWERFNYPVPHDEIQAYILEQLGQTVSASTAADYTKARRAKIKREAENTQILQKIIVSSKDTEQGNGYKMVDYHPKGNFLVT